MRTFFFWNIKALTEFEIQRKGKKKKNTQLSQSSEYDQCGLSVGQDEFFMVSELKKQVSFSSRGCTQSIYGLKIHARNKNKMGQPELISVLLGISYPLLIEVN